MNKCPNCSKGKIFPSSNLFSFILKKMNKKCSHCELDFEVEPGFYIGAMYVSYGISLAEVTLFYCISVLITEDARAISNIIIAVSSLLILFPFNFRLSRLIWFRLFRKKT